MRSLTLILAAAMMLAACKDKPIEPMKPRVGISVSAGAA